MERFFWLLLLWAFFKATAFASQSKFDYLLRLGHSTAAFLDYPFHVATFCANQTSCNLEILVVWDLDVVPTCILSLTIIVELSITLYTLCILLSLWNVTISVTIPSQIAWVCWNKGVLVLARLVDILHLEAVMRKLIRDAVGRSLIFHSWICPISLCLWLVLELIGRMVCSFLLILFSHPSDC